MKVAIVDRVFLPPFRRAVMDFIEAWSAEDQIEVYAEGLAHVSQTIRHRIPLHEVAGPADLEEQVRASRADIVVSIYGLVSTARLATSLAGEVPVVWMLQGMRDADQGLQAPGRRVRVEQLRHNLAGVVASNEMQRSALWNAGFRPAMVHVVAPAVARSVMARSGNELEARQVSSILARWRVAWIGRPIARKNFTFFHDAVARLQERQLRLEAVAVGLHPSEIPDPPLRSCQFRGPLPHDLMLDELAASDLLVVSSISGADGSREAIPQVILEAMALGVPVLAVDCGAIGEVVIHGETGWLSRGRTSRELADDIETFLRSPGLRTSCAYRARAYIETCHQQSDSIRQLRQVLQDILAGSEP